MGRSTTVTALLVVCLLLLSGCVGTNSAPVENPTDNSPTTESPTAPSTTDGTLEVHYIDVGQGAATLLIGPSNETMLIDSGDWRDDGQGVIEYLEREEVTRVDYLITTHADADHIGGHATVIEHFESEGDGIGAVYDPGIAASTQTYESYLDAIEDNDVTLYRTRTGDTIPFEGVHVAVLAPPEEGIADGDRNENSLVLRVTHGNSSFLLPGDTAERGEEYLVQNYASTLDSSVLQVGHHGSRSSSSNEFLHAVTPTVAVMSSDYESQYGHPHQETLDRLVDHDVTTLWTGIHGSVTLSSNGSHLSMFAQSNATTDPLDLRSAPPYAADADRDQTRIGVVSAGDASIAVSDGGRESTPEETTPSETVESPPPSNGGSLMVDTIHADASGNDHENLNDEYITFTNSRESALDLSGWTVRDEASHEYEFPDGFTLRPGDDVTLYSGSGERTSAELYWGSEQAIWNNDGDTIFLHDADGDLVLEESY